MNLLTSKNSRYFRYLFMICCVFTIGVNTSTHAQTKPILISSPDGAIKVSLESKDGSLNYAVSYNNTNVIQPSKMGFRMNGKPLANDLIVKKTERYQVNEQYAYRGVHSMASNHCNGAKIDIASGQNPFTVEVRVFNDGMAFRYIINNEGAAKIDADMSQFAIPPGSTIWSQNNVKYYEGKYGKKMIDTVKTGELMGPPVTIELPGNAGFAAIAEGGLTDFAGMSLVVNETGILQANLAGPTTREGVIETPWRIVEIGKDLNTLVNCDIIANVSPAYDKKLFPDGYATDWVKPGRSVWSWLADHRDITLDNMKKFTDAAADLGFEYNLVDEGWGNWKDSANGKNNWDMMKELVDYSTAKGVKIWVWKAYPDRKGIPGIKEEAQRKVFFKKCYDLGIAGLKVDFFDSESQEIIRFYQAALHDAAGYHLMMDFHGANKPTGEARTWPNEMSREAIRGMENRPPWASSNTILPFTRYLAGHADYTPVNFGGRMGEVSWAHHVASMVVFTSPFLCLGADPKNMLDNPCKEMIQSIPPVWDETIVLPQSKIGELALYARRKGATWFIAGMNGTKDPITIEVNLSFLKGGNWMLSSVEDDAGKQASATLHHSKLSASSKLLVTLNGYGGYVAHLTK
ncbi:MAG: glycoside hydrolase family 97 catalytic domain-containing protein [Chitinophagaceae bacterium]